MRRSKKVRQRTAAWRGRQGGSPPRWDTIARLLDDRLPLPMRRVAHVITGMGFGGAEMMLAKLVGGLAPRFESRIVSLSSEVALADRVRDRGVEVIPLGLRPTLLGGPRAVRAVAAALREWKPDLVQTWLYHADLLGGIAARTLRVPVIWNIQSSTLDVEGIRRRTLAVAELCAAASYVVPAAIVSCSYVGMRVHRRMGYSRRKFRVIPNGADLSIFKPDAEARAAVRAELGVEAGAPLIGMVA